MKTYWVCAVLCLSILLTACGAAPNQDKEAVAGIVRELMESAKSESGAAEPADEKPDIDGSQEPPASQAEPDEPIAIVEPQEQIAPAQSDEAASEREQTAMKMHVQVGTYTFTAALEDNDAVRELKEMMQAGPVTIKMSDYSGFEKVGPLGRSLTTSNSQITTAAGDIVLYNGSNIVMFYGSNSWSYTRIGKIDDLTDWAAALGSGDITAAFTLAE